MLGAAMFVDSAIGLGGALFVFVLGISAVSPAMAQAVGRQQIAIAVYDIMLALGAAAGGQLAALMTDLADLAMLITSITGIGVVIILASARMSREGPTRHVTT